MIFLGVIGYGYWGANLVRDCAGSTDIGVVAVTDLHTERLAHVRKHYRGIATCTDYHELLENPRIDAVTLSTPAFGNLRVAIEALRAGRHVLAEKPLGSTLEEVRQLVETALVCRRLLMVDKGGFLVKA